MQVLNRTSSMCKILLCHLFTNIIMYYNTCIICILKKNVGGAMHFIYYMNRLTATNVDYFYLGCLTSNTQRTCLWQSLNT